jgi:hypothetical protein
MLAVDILLREVWHCIDNFLLTWLTIFKSSCQWEDEVQGEQNLSNPADKSEIRKY